MFGIECEKVEHQKMKGKNATNYSVIIILNRKNLQNMNERFVEIASKKSRSKIDLLITQVFPKFNTFPIRIRSLFIWLAKRGSIQHSQFISNA